MTRNATTPKADATAEFRGRSAERRATNLQSALLTKLAALASELKPFLPKGWTAEPVKYFGPDFDMILVAGPKAKATTAKRQQALRLFDVIRDNFAGVSVTTDGPEIYVVPENWKAPRANHDLNDGQKMNRAFAALRKIGFFAKQNWKCCQGCGTSAMPSGTKKYAFYHKQDAERGWSKADGHTISAEGIYIAWGEEKPEIAAEIVSAFRSEGLKVEWDGELHSRILVKHFEEPVASANKLCPNCGENPCRGLMKCPPPIQWPKFKLTIPNGLDPTEVRIIERAEAVALVSEETVSLMERQTFLTIRIPNDPQKFIQAYSLEDSIRDAAPEMFQALKDVRDAYQKMFDSMPVAFQTYDHIVREAIAKAERIAA